MNLQELLESNNDETLDKLNQEKQKLNKINEEKIKGLLLRSKAEWIEGAEKNTKYFANLEKKRAEHKTITQLNINENIETDKHKILSYVKSYYESLYKRDENIEESMNSRFLTKITNVITAENTNPEHLTEFECHNALKDMKNDKSPGSDGLTAEFYKMFWHDIKIYLIDSLNFSLDNENLTPLQKQSVITLLPKKEKDTININNWRPISLLNIDYKIASKAIANRIKPMLNSVVGTCTNLPEIVNTKGFLNRIYLQDGGHHNHG